MFTAFSRYSLFVSTAIACGLGTLFHFSSTVPSQICQRSFQVGSFQSIIILFHDIYGLLTKCEVKMAGYWPSSYFACLWTETESRSMNTQKRTRPISSHLDRTSSVDKGFIIWLSGKIFLRDKAGSPERAVPSGQDSSILPARVANRSAGFDSSCPLTELAI